MKTKTINSLATTNSQLISPLATTGRPVSLWSFIAFNSGVAAAFVKLYATTGVAPVVGSDVPIMTFAVPAGGNIIVDKAIAALEFGQGLGLAITNLGPDTDTTAVAANQVKVVLGFGA